MHLDYNSKSICTALILSAITKTICTRKAIKRNTLLYIIYNDMFPLVFRYYPSNLISVTFQSCYMINRIIPKETSVIVGRYDNLTEEKRRKTALCAAREAYIQHKTVRYYESAITYLSHLFKYHQPIQKRVRSSCLGTDLI